jgi:hypothetical protein
MIYLSLLLYRGIKYLISKFAHYQAARQLVGSSSSKTVANLHRPVVHPSVFNGQLVTTHSVKSQHMHSQRHS